RKDVLQVSTQELVSRDSGDLSTAITIVAIAEGHPVFVTRDERSFRERRPVNVATEVFDDSAAAAQHGLCVYDPSFLSAKVGEGDVRQGLSGLMQKQPPELGAEGRHGHQVRFAPVSTT